MDSLFGRLPVASSSKAMQIWFQVLHSFDSPGITQLLAKQQSYPMLPAQRRAPPIQDFYAYVLAGIDREPFLAFADTFFDCQVTVMVSPTG